MTRVFMENGVAVPVTVIEVAPNRVTQIKDIDNDGYRALQVTTGSRRAKLLNKARAGHFAKAGVDAGRGLWEFRLAADEGTDLAVGSELKVDRFAVGQKLDARGCTIGKGFAGVVKRYHFHMQDATHGNSLSHRAPGSIGQNQTPGRVFKGKKMAGHMGNVMRTAPNLEVVRVDEQRNLILLKGAVPGPKGGDVILSPAVKAAGLPSD
jgi:large subunit ribosomal protein L3